MTDHQVQQVIIKARQLMRDDGLSQQEAVRIALQVYGFSPPYVRAIRGAMSKQQ